MPLSQSTLHHDQTLSNKVAGGSPAGQRKYQTDDVATMKSILATRRILWPVTKPKLQSRSGSLAIERGSVLSNDFKRYKGRGSIGEGCHMPNVQPRAVSASRMPTEKTKADAENAPKVSSP